MKKNNLKMLFTLLIVGACSLGLKAQDKDEVQVVQGLFGMEKRAIIYQVLKFTDADKAKFDPIYTQYSDEYKALGAERIQIIKEYADNYASLTNEKVDPLMQSLLKNNVAIDKLQQKYYGKLKSAISPTQAAKVMQLELYMQTAIRSELQSEIPIIGELKMK
ncbi:hypothetical protein [Pedobacter sp. MW01-1-1]|uniref:hypothetical protein n=1 Tax=Pedobacter sp. MW01-1-1 TaxID=3383027 RepID=UPI003FF0887B